jgi:hypothetical protein
MGRIGVELDFGVDIFFIKKQKEVITVVTPLTSEYPCGLAV